MGLRDRLKQGVRKVLGREALGAASEPMARPTAPPPSVTRPAAAAAPAVAPASAPTPAPTPLPPSAAVSSAADAPVEAASGPDDPEKAEKIEKARTRARKGVLKNVLKQGGAANMGEVHDYSERRFFIAHRGFSDMMEWWLQHDYIRYEEGIITVTDAGRDYAEAP